MKITKKGEYALKALIELAINYDKGISVTLINDIAGHENIPPKYLEHIMLNLKNSGILTSKRGVGGGYTLSRPPAEISLGEILRTVEFIFFTAAMRGTLTSSRISCITERNVL